MDWAGLLPELLDLIFEKLEFTDNIRLCLVCRPWFCAARSRTVPLYPRWLYFHPRCDKVTRDGVLHFYSPSEDRIYRIPFPEIRGYKIIESTCRFLIAVKYGCLFTQNTQQSLMVDPLNRTTTCLPNDSSFDGGVDCWDYSGSVIMASLGSNYKLYHCYLGDDSWRQVEVMTDYSGIHNIIFKAGRFFVLDWNARLFIFDAETLSLIRRVVYPVPHVNRTMLVTSPLDEIYLVESTYNSELGWICCKLNGFHALQETSRFSRITNIGNRALFVESTTSGFLIEESRNPDWRNSYVYLVQSKEEFGAGTRKMEYIYTSWMILIKFKIRWSM